MSERQKKLREALQPYVFLRPQSMPEAEKALENALLAIEGVFEEETKELKNQLSNYQFLSGLTPEECRYLKSKTEELESKTKELVELIDGCSPVVESWNCISPSQIAWKKEWMSKANEAIDKFIGDNK